MGKKRGEKRRAEAVDCNLNREFAQIKDKILDLSSKYKVPSSEITSLLRSFVDSFSSFEANRDLVPVDIFDSNLGALEALVKYLREDCSMKNKQVSEMTGRKTTTVSTAYRKAVSKFSTRFKIKNPNFTVRLNILLAENYTVLENLIMYLRDNEKNKFSEIAKRLNRDIRSVWTIYNRAQKKVTDDK